MKKYYGEHTRGCQCIDCGGMKPIPYYNQKCGRCDQPACTHHSIPTCEEFVFNQGYFDMIEAQNKQTITLLSQAGTRAI